MTGYGLDKPISPQITRIDASHNPEVAGSNPAPHRYMRRSNSVGRHVVKRVGATGLEPALRESWLTERLARNTESNYPSCYDASSTNCETGPTGKGRGAERRGRFTYAGERMSIGRSRKSTSSLGHCPLRHRREERSGSERSSRVTARWRLGRAGVAREDVAEVVETVEDAAGLRVEELAGARTRSSSCRRTCWLCPGATARRSARCSRDLLWRSCRAGRSLLP